ncbi:MAG: hypothetical protein AAF441_15205 [Pseudomonadota bacterium]
MAGEIQGRFEGEKFSRETIKLDGSEFVKCAFTDCAFVYAGGSPPGISGCNFDRCTWQFAGEAANTLAFLSGFYNGGFADLIEGTFHEIRKGDMLKTEAPAGKGKGGKSFFGIEPLKIFKVPKKK